MANENHPKTKKKLLEESLHGLIQYLHDENADLSIAADYLGDLLDWVDDSGVHTDTSNPPPPPPPPPGQ